MFGDYEDGEKCPNCGSLDTIPWDDGYICRACGKEFGKNTYMKKPGKRKKETDE